jgi:hypothetical protein
MWRSTPMHRTETDVPMPSNSVALLRYPAGVDGAEVPTQIDGHGPLFHRCYRVRIRQGHVDAQELMGALRRNLNQAAPTGFARFHRLLGSDDELERGDEYVVRMPGPWDGPVRVIDVTPRSFRLATLEGQVETGQMDWQVWKWLDTGAVEFRVHSISRMAHIPNPIIRLGFLLVGGRERTAFLESTKRRMRTFTELALDGAHSDGEIEDAAGRLVARPFAGDADANEQVADNLRETQEYPWPSASHDRSQSGFRSFSSPTGRRSSTRRAHGCAGDLRPSGA